MPDVFTVFLNKDDDDDDNDDDPPPQKKKKKIKENYHYVFPITDV